MSSQAAPQIVHESETQRQHVRVQIPARAEIAGRGYMVKDLSVSGASIEGVETPYIDGSQIDLSLMVPFESFSLNVSLKAFVTHYDTSAKRLGCQFTDLTREQLSILNSIIQSYMSGVIIKEGDLLNVVARDNFVKIRRELSKEETRDLKSLARRALPFLFMGVAAVMGGFFVMGNVYEKLMVLKSYQATVQAESIVLRASAPGIFTSALPAGTERISKGQVIATIEVVGYALATPNGQAAPAAAVVATPAAAPAEPATTTEEGVTEADDAASVEPQAGETTAPVLPTGENVVKIVSPCDCFFVRQYVANGLFRDVGEALFKLVPMETKPVIRAIVGAEDIVRLSLRDKANIRITGEDGIIVGVIQEIETADDQASKSMVTIRPERPLSYKLMDRPAYVEFFVN